MATLFDFSFVKFSQCFYIFAMHNCLWIHKLKNDVELNRALALASLKLVNIPSPLLTPTSKAGRSKRTDTTTALILASKYISSMLLATEKPPRKISIVKRYGYRGNKAGGSSPNYY